MFRFLHAADLHLDTPFVGLGKTRENIARRLRDASLKALENLVDTALERQVDFVVLAGDIYDGADRGLRAQLALHRAAERLGKAGVRTFVVHGNHDPVTEGWTAVPNWPELFHRFSAQKVECKRFEARDGTPVEVHGVSYPEKHMHENLAKRFPKGSADAFRVAVLHANVGGLPEHEPYSPCTLDDLRNSGHHYWALGHIHTRQTLHRNPAVVYPGNLQGRTSRETGPRGAVVVQVDQQEVVDIEFAPLDVVRFERISLSLDDFEDVAAAIDAVVSDATTLHEQADGRGLVLTVELSGGGPTAEALARPGTLDELQTVAADRLAVLDPFVWCASWQVDLHESIDLHALRGDDTLLGTVIEDFDALLADPDRLRKLLDEVLPPEVAAITNRLPDLEQVAEQALYDIIGRMQS